MAKRESFFECLFVSDGNEYRFHFRGWDPVDAETHLRDSLRQNGVTARGSLVVLDSRRGIVHRSVYVPSRSETPPDPGLLP